MSWPDGDPCPECGELMDVGAVGNPGETITWQQCDDCQIGWGPYTGYTDLDEESSQDELLEVARDAGMPVEEEVKTVGKCKNPDCDNELPDKGPKKMNLGVDSGYCGLACMLEDDDAV